MPRLTKSVPAYCLHRPSGQARVRLGGVDHYLGPHGTLASKREYDRLIGEWLANGRRASTRGPDTLPAPTIAELVLAYWKFAQGYYVKDGGLSTEGRNIHLALRPLRELYGQTLAADFGPLALKALRQHWIDTGLLRTEVNRRVGRVVRAFRWAVENELVPPAIYQALKAVTGLRAGRSQAKESKPVRPVPDKDVDAIRPLVSRQVWAMIELQRLTGMRPGEVTSMTTGAIDRAGDVWTYSPRDHKMAYKGRQRTIYLGPRAQAILREWLRADPDAYLFSPREAREERYAKLRAGRKTPVQPSQVNRKKAKPMRAPGGQYDVPAYNRAISAACLKAGAPHWHPHQLRHSAATAIRREFGVDVARVLLGHSSPVVTEIYAELDHEKAVDAVRKIG